MAPIVCSNAGPMPEVLQNTGQIYQKSDSESLLMAIIALIKNKKRERH